MDDYKFQPDDFELIGDKQNIMIDEVEPARPLWKDILARFFENKGAVIGVILIILIMRIFIMFMETGKHIYYVMALIRCMLH